MSLVQRTLKIIDLDLNQACQEVEFPADARIYGPVPLSPQRLLVGSPVAGGAVLRKVWLLSNVDAMQSHPQNVVCVEAQQNEMVGTGVVYSDPNRPRYFVIFVETQVNAATRANTMRR